MVSKKKDEDIVKKNVKIKKKVSKKNDNKTVKVKINGFKEYLEKVFKIKKKNSKKKEMYTIKEVVTVMLFSLGIGFIMCFGCMSLFTGKNYITVVKDLDKVVDTYYAIVDNYYGDLDKDALVDGAVEGMISSVGDVFTSYTDTQDTESFDETIKGSYEGIGCTVATYSDGSIVVIDIFEGSPSDKAGLKVNDKIVKVDNESYTNKNSNDMANYIKNSGKSSIVLTVLREENEFDVTVSLSKVEIPSVSGEVI